ncbi:MAG TPA: L-fucose/L-arabinose isomerase family protein [Planctomycetota bacterium]|nr:L-fucose/L-arabinose isomerase family protein [Planctomycetota bacterium]
MAEKMTFGLVVGSRGFFPEHLVADGRKEMLKVLKDAGYNVVCLSPDDTKHGSVESREDIRKCAQLFRKNSEKIDGIIVTLPNFGDERGVTDSIAESGLDVPVLVQAYPDVVNKMGLKDRRDSFCGKISVCNNLRQRNISYTLTDDHTVDPKSDDFAANLATFAATCRVVNGVCGARIGAIGARPSPFTTVRYSEKLLESAGISVVTLDLSEVLAGCDRLSDGDGDVKGKIKQLSEYCNMKEVPAKAVAKMAKFALVIDRWMAENEIDASAVQCWTAIEEIYGITPCAVMGMMSDKLIPSACEVDVTGCVGMLALTLAAEAPAALLDWNNNYGEDPDKCVLFHCSNLPKSVFTEMKVDYQKIIASSVGKENAYGACVGRMTPGPMTFCRVSTDDNEGLIQAYVGEGELTDDPLDTFGGYGVAQIENLQGLMQVICRMGFEHHVALTQGNVADAVVEALENYLGWEVYYHG